MEGRHILIEASAYSGSEFFNYKGTLSIVLSGVVDATYKFLYVNVGCQGRISDGDVFRSTAFHKLLEDCSLKFATELCSSWERKSYSTCFCSR